MPQAEKPEPTSKWPGYRVAHPDQAGGRVLHGARLAARAALEDLRAGKLEECERRLAEMAGDLADGPSYEPGPRMSDWDRDQQKRRPVAASPTR